MVSDRISLKNDSGGNTTYLLWLGSLLILAVGIWLYLPTVEWLIQYWRKDEYYAHGPLLPFITAYLIWNKWPAIRKAWVEREPIGIRPSGLIFLALAMQFLGSLAEINTVRALQGFSIPILLLGLARYFGGQRLERELRFPLLFLFLCIPLSGPMFEVLTLPMQSYAASAASIFLGLLGIPIHREGVNLYTPLYHFVVDVPCSGLKITISLFTMGLLIAHVMPKLSQFQRWVLCILSIPVALLANTSRVMCIVLLGYNFGTKVAEGFLHNWSGLFMFSLSLVLLVGTGTYMARTPAAPVMEQPPETSP